MKPCPVIHFEIGCDQHQATLKFYKKSFGWSSSKGQYNTRFDTGSKQGIQGHLTTLGHEPKRYIQFYIEVASISEHVKIIENNGGELHIGPLPTGEGRFFAWINDPEGNMLGLISKIE